MPPAYLTLSSIFRRQSAGPVIKDGTSPPTGDWRASANDHPEDLVLESWSQGFIVGALIVMACITIANMRRRVLLHKLILLELFLAMSHGTFCFMDFHGYGWYLSATAMLLYISWIIHNVVAWMKVRPFFIQPGGFFRAKVGIWVQGIYLYSLALTVPVIAFQIQDNYRFFNNRGGWYTQIRPYEPLFRDPWWVFTCLALFHVIRKCYGTGVMGLVSRSPRFGILLAAIALSMAFTVVDIIASIHPFLGDTDGINPWWKLALVFKCLTDTIMLDDFKTELKRLGIKRIEKEEARRNSIALVAEYPSGLDGNSQDYTRPRRDTLFHFKHSPFHSKSTSRSSTRSPGFKDHRDENEDPLSEYTAQRESHRQPLQEKKRRGTNSSNTEQDQVEFATALNIDPSHLSGVESVRRSTAEEAQGRRTPPPRENVRTTTKKLGKLPGLNHFRFEAIKPGKRSKHNDNDHDDEDDDDDGDDDSDEMFQTRNLAEEINRTTMMDLEAQKREKEAKKKDKEKVKKKKVFPSHGHDHDEDSDDSSDRDRQEDLERLRRFRASIGVAE